MDETIQLQEETTSYNLFNALKATRGYPGIPIREIAAQILATFDESEIQALIKELK